MQDFVHTSHISPETKTTNSSIFIDCTYSLFDVYCKKAECLLTYPESPQVMSSRKFFVKYDLAVKRTELEASRVLHVPQNYVFDILVLFLLSLHWSSDIE